MGFLVNEGIYNVTRMYDYQGLCPEEEEASNPAPPMSTVSRPESGLLGTHLSFHPALREHDVLLALDFRPPPHTHTNTHTQH